MNIPDLKKQITEYENNKRELETLSRIDKDFRIDSICLSSPNVLIPLHLSNPKLSKDVAKLVNDILFPEILAIREELEIDIKDFEFRVREIRDCGVIGNIPDCGSGVAQSESDQPLKIEERIL